MKSEPQTQRHKRSITEDFSVKQMYDKIYNNQIFGIQGYEPKRNYVDAAKQIKDKDLQVQLKKPYSQRPKAPKATKRGHYYDEIFKQTKGVPGPQKYKVEKEWFTKAMIEKAKRPGKKIEKCTFIDQIFKNAKRGQVPGVGKYNVTETQDQIKKQVEEQKKRRIKEGEKPCYISEDTFQGVQVPGPGFYNPRDEISKIKVDNTKPEQWIKKHKEKSKQKSQSVPPIGLYKNDFPADYDTFGKMLYNAKEKGKQFKSVVKHFGTEERAKDPKKSKSTFFVSVPGAGQYPLIAHWPGKKAPKNANEKQKNWMNNVSRGISKSIYY